jgi:thiosulfate/3-mercaptopyruvate sulfurtransferase
MWREELLRLSPIFHFRWLLAAPTAMHRPTSLRTLFSPLAAALCLASCAAQRPAPRPTPTEALVSAAQLPGELARLAHNAVLLDVRERAAYDEGHVAGALHLPLEEWERASLSEESGLAHDAAWRARIGALGIDGDDTVLVYDSGKMTSAARVWFVLQHFGVARAAVVDGGFPLLAQVAAQGALPLQSAPSVRTPTTFEPASPALVGLVDRTQMRLAVERGEAQVLDVRTPAEFRGEDKRKNARGGHLPNAVNVPHTELLDAQGRLRPAEELRSILSAAGFAPGRPVITHCDGGGRAALAALAAARAGYGPVLNYYLSFGDWAKDSTCPVVVD